MSKPKSEEANSPLANAPVGHETPTTNAATPINRRESRWIVESQSGRFSIDYDSDGAVVIVDRLNLDPVDSTSDAGIFVVIPEDADVFLRVMVAAVELHREFRNSFAAMSAGVASMPSNGSRT